MLINVFVELLVPKSQLFGGSMGTHPRKFFNPKWSNESEAGQAFSNDLQYIQAVPTPVQH